MWTRKKISQNVFGFTALSAAGALLLQGVGGCASDGADSPGGSGAGVATYRDEASGVLGDLATTFEPGESTWKSTLGDDPDDTWSILIAQFPATEQGRVSANNALRLVRTKGRLEEAYLKQRGEAIALLYGDHEELDDSQVRRDLAYVRGLEVAGERPYAGAIVAPPDMSDIAGTMPKFDLRRAKEVHGKDALYTLQIGLYGRLDRSRVGGEELAEYRQAAEDAVRQLRAQGEQAFYYHGPTRSTITVGIFTDQDHDSETGVAGESAKLREIRRRHPHNLLNGKGIMEKRRDASGRPIEALQRSRLVPIPG